MSETVRHYLIGSLLVLLAAACGWWWFDNMELQREARHEKSQAARDNPMLGATLLLRQHGSRVEVHQTLGGLGLAGLANGTLLLASEHGVTTPQQASALLAWVSRGNTLVLIAPRRRSAPGAVGPVQPDLVQADPISARLGVERTEVAGTASGPCVAAATITSTSAPTSAPSAPPKKTGQSASPAPPTFTRTACLRLPASASTWQLRVYDVLQSGATARRPAWADSDGKAVRAYTEGRGQIIVLASNFFEDGALRQADHAAVLLELAALRQGAVHIVLANDMPHWTRALWQRFSLAVLGLALTLLLLLWAAVRRFGPLLPEPDQQRRAVLEHIDASGRWLWASTEGRQALLDASRTAIDTLLQRRAPELMRLAPEVRARTLARLCGLPDADLQRALRDAAAPHGAAFTRQLQTLHHVRAHYER